MTLFTFGEIRTACSGNFNVKDPDLDAAVECVVTDSREKTDRALFVALEGARFDAHDFLENAMQNGAVLLIVNEKKQDRIPRGATALLVKDTLKAYQDLASFHRKRFPDLKLVALTGSYGKTSTKEILRSIFVRAVGEEHVLATEGNFNNQIGVPKTLLRLTGEHRYAVVEMGTNHFGEIAPLAQCAMPQASLIVSIGNCHLEFLRDHDGVAQEKSDIFKPGSVQTAVFPLETPQRGILERAALRIPAVSTFGKTPQAAVQAIYRGGSLHGSTFDLIQTSCGKRVTVEWSLSGEHQAVNCAGAAALALEMGICLETIAEGVRSVTLPGHRMQRKQHGNAFWINDSYNANPDSMCAALTSLAEFADPEKLLLVLGDMGELGIHRLEGHLKVLSFASETFPGSRIVAVGPAMAQAVEVLEQLSAGSEKRFIRSGSARKASTLVRSLVREGDIVFLKGSHSTNLGIIEEDEESESGKELDITQCITGLKDLVCSVCGNLSEQKISFITMDSRTVRKGSLFCAIRGEKQDGHDYLDQAVEKGAVCCVIARDCPWQGPENFPVLRVSDPYFAWALLCGTFMGRPADDLKLFAVTGTNGKTTVTFLLRHILKTAYADKKCGLVTTVEYDTGSGAPPQEGTRTTPSAMDLQKLFAWMKQGSCTYAVMEQSSHGLHQHRAGDLLYEGAVFTNLTGDHLDYHGDMEHYFQAKKTLFTQMLKKDAPAVIWIDDPWGERLLKELQEENLNVCGVTLCGKDGADASVEEIHTTLEGSSFTLIFEGKKHSFRTPLCGLYNVCNTAEALLLALKKGIGISALQKAAETFNPVPGRLEKFFLEQQKAYAFVDYAHTDDALRQVLQTLSGLSPGRIITLFGCGGDRDRTKRPRMAQAASEYSSAVILTNDNPRSEDPAEILKDIAAGFPENYPVLIEENRALAIEKALSLAEEDDMVLIAGKGHENYQEIKGVKNHFDDREVVLQYLKKKNQPTSGEI